MNRHTPPPPTFDEMRHLVLDGRTIVVQTPNDPGDIGEPRISTVDDTTYVCVPEFELWPTDPDWQPHDASIVFINTRSLTMDPPGKVIYHLPRAWSYGSVTRCGIVIWANDQRESKVQPIRRDIAARIARACRICGVGR